MRALAIARGISSSGKRSKDIATESAVLQARLMVMLLLFPGFTIPLPIVVGSRNASTVSPKSAPRIASMVFP
jgi:hypothetical protein